MKALSIVFAASLAALVGQPLYAEQISISAEQMAELGILLGTPERTDRGVEVSATGQVVVPPAGQFAVSSVEPGVVYRLHAAVGDRVEQGQLLAEIRSPGFITTQREYLGAQSEATLQAGQLERDQQLFEEGIIAQRRLQESQVQASAALARQAELRQLLQIGGMGEAQIRQLEQQRKLQPGLELHSPLAGSVVELMAMTGDRLEAMAPVYRIADLSTLWLDIQLAGELAYAVRPGMRVLVDSRGSRSTAGELQAAVLSVGQLRDEHSQTVSVRAEVKGPSGQLQPGQFVAVRIVEPPESRQGNWALPLSAVIHDGQQSYVFVGHNGSFERLPAELLSIDGEVAYIAAGLDEGSQVAIAGVVALKALWAGEQEDGS